MVRRTTTGIIRTAHLVRRAADQTHRRRLYVADSGNMKSYIISPVIGSQDLTKEPGRTFLITVVPGAIYSGWIVVE